MGGFFNPYASYDVRKPKLRTLGHPSEDGGYDGPERDRKKPPPSTPAPPPKPERPRGPQEGGVFTTGTTSYDDVEPEPPYPTERDHQIARGEIEASEEEYNQAKSVLREWRAYAARKGEWEINQIRGGVIPGKMKHTRLNMLSNYGQDFANVDLDNRRMWDTREGQASPYYPGGSTPPGGGWVPMDKQTFDDVMNFRARRDSTRGQGFQKHLGFTDQTVGNGRGPDLRFAAVERMDWLDDTTRAGHLTKDPASGYSYNVGSGNKDAPETWEWYDQFGRPSGPPPGFGGGVLPNRYELNTPGNTTPYPTPGTPGFGTGMGFGVSTAQTQAPKFGATRRSVTPAAPGMPQSTSFSAPPSSATSMGFGSAWGGAVQPKMSTTTASPMSAPAKPRTPGMGVSMPTVGTVNEPNVMEPRKRRPGLGVSY